LKANFFYSDLNPCGGGERLTLVTMRAVFEMGIDIYLTTLEKPNISRLENAYGKDFVSVLGNLKKINVLRMLDEQNISKELKNEYDIIINTHGDIDPYYSDTLCKNNAITYCHFPSAKFYIENEEKAYLEKQLKINRALTENDIEDTTISKNKKKDNFTEKIYKNNFDKKQYLKWLKETYDKMMQNTTLLTNSEYSRKAIFDTYGIKDCNVLYPPVDVNRFCNSISTQYFNKNKDKREDIILVVSRIDPSKEIEKAIKLAKLLKEKEIGIKMLVAGSLDSYFNDYYLYLKKTIEDNDLFDYVKIEINITFNKLLSFMKKSKIYFHPRPGEHFGISIVEAMCAGLIPIVADKGGQTEFVPKKYQYRTLEQASQIILHSLDASDLERLNISNSVQRFSTSNYIKNFQHVVNKLILKKGHNKGKNI
jgi:glycosyltransferase involved in cell wall biosynthesis